MTQQTDPLAVPPPPPEPNPFGSTDPAVWAAPPSPNPPAPPEPTKRGPSTGKVVGIVAGVLLVPVLLAVVAIAALTFLGTTVETTVEPVGQSGSDSVEQTSAENVVAPADAVLFEDPSRSFTMATSPAWAGPRTVEDFVVEGDQFFWFLNDYSSSTFATNVNAFQAAQPFGVTLEALMEAEVAFLEPNGIEVFDYEMGTRTVNGSQFGELTIVGRVEGTDVMFLVLIRLDGNVSSTATLSAPIDRFDEARAHAEPYMLSLDVPEI